MGNTNLSSARAAKNDEFYTQWRDIENEMMAYWVHNKDVFKDKTILLPCDDPEWSQFTRFFARNFEQYQIKKLISTSYAPASNAAIDTHQPAQEELERSDYDPERSWTRGRKYVLERGVDLTGDGQIDLDDLQWEYLEGDGDFRSEEVTALRDEADMVITNPPFSLYREFVAWLVEGGVQFSIIGNKNSITYKEIFPLIKDNKMWVGYQSMSRDMLFDLPKKDQEALLDSGKPGSKYRIVDGEVLGRAAALWFTNIPHGRRYEKLQLMTMADNLMYSRRKKIREEGYPEYDNYDAIEVAFTEAIPKDYDGVMGVPISFLDKYNPEQFEIVGMAKRGAGDPALKTRVYTKDDYPNYSDLNAGPALRRGDVLKNTYPRILIRHKKI